MRDPNSMKTTLMIFNYCLNFYSKWHLNYKIYLEMDSKEDMLKEAFDEIKLAVTNESKLLEEQSNIMALVSAKGKFIKEKMMHLMNGQTIEELKVKEYELKAKLVDLTNSVGDSLTKPSPVSEEVQLTPAQVHVAKNSTIVSQPSI
jgi:hypothetical protein